MLLFKHHFGLSSQKVKFWWMIFFSSVQLSCSLVSESLRPHVSQHARPPPVHCQLPEFTQTHVHWVGNAIQPSHPLLSLSPPAFSLSHIRVFSNESALPIRCPKYWSFSFNISPPNEHTPFPIWNQSVVPCPGLTVASWVAYRFLTRQITWSSIPISFRIFHNFIVIQTVKGFGIVNKAEIDAFLELSCFFYDPAKVWQFDLWFLCLF